MTSNRTTRLPSAPRRGGWLLAEMLTSIILLTMLLGGLAFSQATARKFNAVQLTRQRCLAAGEAQLDSLAARGRRVAAEDVARLWPGIVCDLKFAPGQGVWQGLTQATVTARGRVEGREYTVQLARYFDRPLETQP